MLVDSIELVPGGYARHAFGRGLGAHGLGRHAHARRPSACAAASPPTPSTPPRSSRSPSTSASASASPSPRRVSYLKRWADRTARPVRSAPSCRSLATATAGLRSSIKPTSRDRIEIVGLASGDRVLARDPQRRSCPRGPRPSAASTSARVYARWTRDYDDGGSLTVTPFVGYTRARQVSSYGDVATSSPPAAGWSACGRIGGSAPPAGCTSTSASTPRSTSPRWRAAARSGLPAREGDYPRASASRRPTRSAATTGRPPRSALAPYARAELSLDSQAARPPRPAHRPYARSVSRRNPPTPRRPGRRPVRARTSRSSRASPSSASRTGASSCAAPPASIARCPPPRTWRYRATAACRPPRPAHRRRRRGQVHQDLRSTSPPSSPSNRLAMLQPGRLAAARQGAGADRQRPPLRRPALLRQKSVQEPASAGSPTPSYARSSRTAPTRPCACPTTTRPTSLPRVLADALPPRRFEVSGRFRYATGFPRTPWSAPTTIRPSTALTGLRRPN